MEHRHPSHKGGSHRRERDDKDAAADAGIGDLQALVQVRRQARYWLEYTGWHRVLVYADSILSILSVVVYIWSTYNVEHKVDKSLSTVDFALAIYFLAYWLLRFWLAERRLQFLLSWSTLLDAVTIIPVFVLQGLGSLAASVPVFFFLRILRILRVLRLFNMTKATERLESAVSRASINLALTMVSMMVIAGALLLEIEKHGPNKDRDSFKSMDFHEALYWSTITLTTVGYGDYSPSWWASQLVVMLVLLIAFTVLPLMTGRLVDALNSSTKYQRGRHKKGGRTGGPGHFVFLGHLDAETLTRLADEIYHEDKGFDDRCLVFLNPAEPSFAVRRALMMHPRASQMKYLQGSPFRPLDLERTQAEYAEAVFIIADKHSADPGPEDRRNILQLLAVGQYLAERAVCLHHRYVRTLPLFRFFIGSRPPTTLPCVVVQLLLPESRQALQANLQALSGLSLDRVAKSHRFLASQLDDPSRWFEAYAATSAVADPHKTLEASPARTAGAGGAGGVTPASPAAARPRSWSAARAFASFVATGNFLASESDRSRHQKRFAELGDEEVEQTLNIVTGAAFWRRLTAGVEVVCVGELRGALLAHSALGCPGVSTLLGNLLCSFDGEQSSLFKRKDAPRWMLNYIAGASQEFYEVPCFPRCLHGRTFREAAAFAYDEYGSILVATDDLGERGGAHLHVAPLNMIIDGSMSGYLIAGDVRQALALTEAPADAFEAWRSEFMRRVRGWEAAWDDKGGADGDYKGSPEKDAAVSGPPGDSQPQGSPFAAAAAVAEEPAAAAPPSAGAQLPPATRSRSLSSGAASGSGGAAAGGDSVVLEMTRIYEDAAAATGGPPSSSVPPRTPGGGGARVSFSGSDAPAALTKAAAGRRPATAVSDVDDGGSTATGARSGTLASRSVPLTGSGGMFDHRPRAEFAAARGAPRWAGHALPAQRRDIPAALSIESEALPSPRAFASAAGAGSISGTLMPSAAGGPGSSAALEAGMRPQHPHRAPPAGLSESISYALPGHLLRAASRRGRDIAEAFIEHRYHCRGPEEALGAEGIIIDGPVPFRSHILVFGPIPSIEALLTLLAPLRSKRLTRWRPVVVVDTVAPEAGSSWDDVARLKDVWFCLGSPHFASDLLRANAEHAAAAILLPGFDSSGEDDAALQAAAMCDGVIIETWQQLKTINPGVQINTEMMRQADMAYLSPMTPIAGVEMAQVDLSPAYMSGSVFLAHTLDSLTIQAYTNHGAHRIILKLMHQWHSGDPKLLSRSMGRHHTHHGHSSLILSPHPNANGEPGLNADSLPLLAADSMSPRHPASDAAARERRDQALRPESAAAAGGGGSSGKGVNGGAADERHKQQPQQQQRRSGESSHARDATIEQLHAPTVVLVAVEPAFHGWEYGAFWHHMLRRQGLMALGLYRPVRQQGQRFDCVTTHPAPETVLRPGDRAYVIANLDFAAAASHRRDASLWPRGALGFDRGIREEEAVEFASASAALLRAKRGGGGAA